jgi:hypothetical protein
MKLILLRARAPSESDNCLTGKGLGEFDDHSLSALPTTQCPALAGPTRRIDPADRSLSRWYLIPSSVRPNRLASPRCVIDGSARNAPTILSWVVFGVVSAPPCCEKENSSHNPDGSYRSTGSETPAARQASKRSLIDCSAALDAPKQLGAGRLSTRFVQRHLVYLPILSCGRRIGAPRSPLNKPNVKPIPRLCVPAFPAFQQDLGPMVVLQVKSTLIPDLDSPGPIITLRDRPRK